MIAVKKENGIITQYIEDENLTEVPEGFEEITNIELQNHKTKIELENIDHILEANFDEFAKLEKLAVKTPEQQARFDYLKSAKTQLETKKQQLLDNQA